MIFFILRCKFGISSCIQHSIHDGTNLIKSRPKTAIAQFLIRFISFNIILGAMALFYMLTLKHSKHSGTTIDTQLLGLFMFTVFPLTLSSYVLNSGGYDAMVQGM